MKNPELAKDALKRGLNRIAMGHHHGLPERRLIHQALLAHKYAKKLKRLRTELDKDVPE